MFPPALREFIEIWVGANVATGNEDLGYDSRNAYSRLADDVEALSDAMKSAVATAGDSLPPRIATEFVAAVKTFVDDGGRNHLQDFSTEIRATGRRQVDRSIQLSESKYQILLEFIFMNLELALIAALAVFTGGTSVTQVAVVKARSALAILLILQRMGRAVPTPLSALFEAIQEAFITFAAQVMSMTLPDIPDRRRKDFDWGDIGQSAVLGALAGAFGGFFSQATAPFFKDFFKKNPGWKEVYELPHTFVNEGQAETFATTFTNLFFFGTFAVNPATFVSAGLSGALYEGASDVAGYGGKWVNKTFFPELNWGRGDVDHQVEGGGGGGGRGSGADNNRPVGHDFGPLPRPYTASTYENPESWDGPGPVGTANGSGTGPSVAPYRSDVDNDGTASFISDLSSGSGSSSGFDSGFDSDSEVDFGPYSAYSDTSSVPDYDSAFGAYPAQGLVSTTGPGATTGLGVGGTVKYSSTVDGTVDDVWGDSSGESIASVLNPPAGSGARGFTNNPYADAGAVGAVPTGSGAPATVSAMSTAPAGETETGSGEAAGALGASPGQALSDDAKLDAGRGFSALMQEIGHPVVLGGDAQGRVQFDNPRPLGTLEFHLPSEVGQSEVGQFADDINRALADAGPGVSPDALRVGPDGRSLNGLVQGTEISVGTAPHAFADTTVTDGFTVPAVTESLADTAYALALTTDEQQRARDLFDLLWGLSHTPADNPLPPARLEARHGDAYRAAHPSGAAPTLTARLSELLDGVARNPDTRSVYEATWSALGAVPHDLTLLNEQLTALAETLRASEAMLPGPAVSETTAPDESVVREAEAELTRAEQAVRDAEALPTAEQVQQARLEWRQARAEARNVGRTATESGPRPGPDRAADAQERAATAQERWLDLQRRYEGGA
ncbi:hypothetical protein, partial [Streptomyces sp. SID3212]|uniref:hypothetical protein n=1 Tax=Streptomyces sp. SID3212 TaxID=2690259 RepID=UPI00136C56D0